MHRNILVTGAGSGLGLDMSLYLATRGFKVYATVPEPSQRALPETHAARQHLDLQVLLLDITKQASIDAAIRTVIDQDGGLFGLVNNAGISLRGYFEDLDDTEIRRTLEVNLFGAMAITRAALPHMRTAGRGRLVYISSIGGRVGAMARTAYCASKFGLEGFAESLMQEVAPLGLQVCIVEPAIVKTERWTTNRGISRRALDPQGPYYSWFRAEERLADRLVRTSPTTPSDVSHAVYQALTVDRPRLRYLVGRRARFVLALRRYVPGDLFERLYFGEAMRRVTASQHPGPNQLRQLKDKKVHKDISALKALRALGLSRALHATRIRRFSQDMLRGYYTTRAIIALFNVGLLDEFARQGAVNLDVFAANHDLDAKVLYILCDYLYAVNLLTRIGGSYALDRTHRLTMDALNGPFYSVYAYQHIFHNLEQLLRKEKRYGEDVTREPAFVARGSGAVGTLLAFPLVIDVLDRNHCRQILDLCCGDATFLIDLCSRRIDLRAYGLDVSPEAIALGRRQLEQHHLQDRVALIIGDVLAIDSAAGNVGEIDVATCVYALHEFIGDGEDQLLTLLHRFKARFPGVPLVICEVIRHTPEELRARPGGVAEIQLWHELSNQRLLSRAEWKAVFRKAGFSHIQEDYFAVARTAIFTIS